MLNNKSLTRIAMVSLLAATSAVSTAQEYFYIEHKPTGNKLFGCSEIDGAPVVTEKNHVDHQCAQWEKIPAEDQYFYLRNRFTGKQIRPAGEESGSSIEARPQSWTWHYTQWSYIDRDDGHGHLANRATGTFLYLPGNDVDVLAKPTSESSSWKGDFTRWRFVPVASDSSVTVYDVDMYKEGSSANGFSFDLNEVEGNGPILVTGTLETDKRVHFVAPANRQVTFDEALTIKGVSSNAIQSLTVTMDGVSCSEGHGITWRAEVEASDSLAFLAVSDCTVRLEADLKAPSISIGSAPFGHHLRLVSLGVGDKPVSIDTDSLTVEPNGTSTSFTANGNFIVPYGTTISSDDKVFVEGLGGKYLYGAISAKRLVLNAWPLSDAWHSTTLIKNEILNGNMSEIRIQASSIYFNHPQTFSGDSTVFTTEPSESQGSDGKIVFNAAVENQNSTSGILVQTPLVTGNGTLISDSLCLFNQGETPVIGDEVSIVRINGCPN